MTTAAFVAVCPVEEIPPGLARTFLLGEEVIAIFRNREGKVFALPNRCPHRGGPLADGFIVGEQIVCPLHAYRFHGETGECEQPSICSLKTYPVEIVEGIVHLGVPRE
jgi:nitrite reductase (NADH) small subunit